MRGGDYYGPVVNLASRIGDLAVPSEILVTNEVYLRIEFADADVSKTLGPGRAGAYAFESAGHLGFGDASGSKQSGEKTWLRDAFENGAEFLVRTRAHRVLAENGHAAGVEAVYTGDDGSESRRVTVRAPGPQGITPTQTLTAGRGFGSTDQSVLHFGLGRHTRAERVEIRWPDGTSQTLTNVKADQTITVRRDKPPAR